MVTQKKTSTSSVASNGGPKNNREQGNMSFQKKDVNDIHVSSNNVPKRDGRSQNGTSTGFRTDTAISGNKIQGERTLQRWQPDSNINTDMSLEAPSNGGAWDQFAENERLFGVTTSYDENIYTTRIDKSRPDYARKVAEADRKAAEIEGSIATSSHVAEERITDNLLPTNGGPSEEEKYSGVLGKISDSAAVQPLSAADRSNVYKPPARRAPTGQATVTGAPVDPAIISSQLAKPTKTVIETSKSPQPAAPVKPDVVAPAPAKEPTTTATTETKVPVADIPSTATRTPSTQATSAGPPNATATVEYDVTKAFKSFATQQRSTVEKVRLNKARQDKESKLSELKRFSENFKLHSPVPKDLIPIIAKDAAKQREIVEKSIRNAEQQEQIKQVKSPAVEATAPTTLAVETRTTQRPPTSPHGTVSSSATPIRQPTGRGSGYPSQQGYNSQPFRNGPAMQTQMPQQRPAPGNLGGRLRSMEHRNDARPPPVHNEARQPPTGPANGVDGNYSRRSSGAASVLGNKLNPNSKDFRPNANATSFNPNGASSRSSPLSHATTTPQGQNGPIPTPSGSLLRKRQLSGSAKPFLGKKFDLLEHLSKAQPPPGREQNWKANGGFKPAFDTQPTWRQLSDTEPANSNMHLTYTKLFERPAVAMSTISPSHPANAMPQTIPHQHQLPFHMQQGAQMAQRQSPRQPPVHMHNNHSHGPNVPYNNADDHRMIPSHSAQSFASPRLQQANMAYGSPMGAPAQLVYNQNNMQYPMGPNGPQMPQYRSYSGGHGYPAQQPAHMGGQVMVQGQSAQGYMGPQGMGPPGPPMMYSVGAPQYMPQGPPPNMVAVNGYSPGRGAPMMMHSGSQQGYGMSPGMPFAQPIYAQQPPGQVSNMRGGYPQNQQQYGTSPQMHQYNQPHRGQQGGGYNNRNNHNQHQHGPHNGVQHTQVPPGPHARPETGEDVK